MSSRKSLACLLKLRCVRRRIKGERLNKADLQGVQSKPAQPGTLTHVIPARHKKVVSAIDNHCVNSIASLAGSPMDKTAGVDLSKKVGDGINGGEPLYRLHVQFQAHFNLARSMIEKDTGFTISENIDTDTLNA